MGDNRSFSGVAAFDFAMVASVGLGVAWIWEDRVPTTTILGYATLVVGFGIASLIGSWFAWRIRLPRNLSPVLAIAFHLGACLIMCVVPIMAVRLSEIWGLWVFCAWAVIGSYVWGFLFLNTKRARPYAG